MTGSAPVERPGRTGREALPIETGWQVAGGEPGRDADGPAGGPEPRTDDAAALARLDALEWLPAKVPGTVAGAFRAAGREPPDLDGRDWWYRTTFDAAPAEPGEDVVLVLDGLATIADVFLNGEPILHAESMFERHRVDVGRRLRGRNELVLRFGALAPRLARSHKPRARWRTRLVADNNLRWIRTTLIGRIPGFAPGPAVVGPWRPIRLERAAGPRLEAIRLRPSLDGPEGVLRVEARLVGDRDRPAGDLAASVVVEGPSGSWRAALSPAERDAPGVDPRPGDATRGRALAGEVRIPDVATWWPHTHGEPVLHDVRLELDAAGDTVRFDAGRAGFRAIRGGTSAAPDIDRDGLFVHVNDVPVFARGALWTPLDAVTLGASEAELREALLTVREAGMNMLRLPGFGVYETDAFHRLCDELGILVWQDLMFASMDYPFDEPSFGAAAAAEVSAVAGRLAAHPSTAVVCGGSEVLQQIAMLGLDLELLRTPFYDEVAPRLVREAGSDAIYVPGAPSGGELPLRPDRGVSNYYAVGGYRAPLSDARTSGVRFASECLAFANVPDEDLLATLVPEPPHDAFMHHPRWKAGVPRDSGSGWDFDDLRDDYLAMLFGVEPRAIRRGNHDRYLELSRAVSGEVMAAVFGEWRRAGSPSGGGMILWLRDLVAGAGWGVVDHRGRPKAAWYHLRRILAPTAVWLVDEGIGGVIAHVANDGAEPLQARLRVAFYSDLELPVGTATTDLELPAHGSAAHDVEALLGHFVDAAWAYRFGPPAHDAIVASLERPAPAGGELLAQAFHFPAGRPLVEQTEGHLGIEAAVETDPDAAAAGGLRLTVGSRRLAYGVRIHVEGFAPSDDAFSVEPGGTRVVRLRPRVPGAAYGGGSLSALNLRGRVALRDDRTPA